MAYIYNEGDEKSRNALIVADIMPLAIKMGIGAGLLLFIATSILDVGIIIQLLVCIVGAVLTALLRETIYVMFELEMYNSSIGCIVVPKYAMRRQQ